MAITRNVRLFLLVSVFISLVNGARILMIFPPPVPSHFILSNRLATELSKKGHDVTLVNPLVSEKSTVYKGIVLSGMAEAFEDIKKTLINVSGNKLYALYLYNQVSKMMTETTLRCNNIKKLLQSNQKFDLVIMEAVFNEAHLGFSHHFNATTVIFSSIGANMMVNHYARNPAPPAYIADQAMDYVDKMDFLQRFLNTVLSIGVALFEEYVRFPMQNEILHTYFPDAPHIKELTRKVSLILLNSHTSISMPVPLVPNMIEIGGFHVSEPQELPQDLKDYLDNANEGFIFFSMGSNVRNSMYPKETWQVFEKVFSKLPYKILWKFDEELSNNASNIRIGKWLPQNDILAHKNIKLFITHGGLLSMTEAVHHGVPIIGIPAFGDQVMNVQKAEKLGIGKQLTLNNVNETNLLQTITEVLNNESYRNNVRMRSQIMKDQPFKPIDNAIFWIEYALRHKNANHFKTAALDLEWYELMMLDIIAFVTSCLFIGTMLLYCLFKRICMSYCLRSRLIKQKTD